MSSPLRCTFAVGSKIPYAFVAKTGSGSRRITGPAWLLVAEQLGVFTDPTVFGAPGAVDAGASPYVVPSALGVTALTDDIPPFHSANQGDSLGHANFTFVSGKVTAIATATAPDE